ncbi:MAG: CRISPR-associated endonuclease Cas1 [SAR324 cluster bacterium]|nr:CRISPR-associated endonuclease Cas1 [SAR324 cluster bacterium]
MISYVKQQGSVIVRRGDTLQVLKDDTRHTIFVHRLDQLVIYGHAELTLPAINLLCREKIDTIFLTVNGRYKGRLETEESKNVFLTKKQFDSLNHPEFGLNFAKAVVNGKLSNMATLVGRLKRRNKQLSASQFEKPAQAIFDLIPKAEQADNLDSLRGYEGLGTAHFFEGFRLGFKEDQSFHKRIRRPPTDPVNSVLSFLYTLLFNRVYAAIRITGLHPGVGYLHSLDYGRYSLALDLMEEFRSLIVETCVLSLFNLKILTKNDFYFENPPPPEPEVKTHPSVKDDSIGLIYENADDGYFDTPEQKVEENTPQDHVPTEKRPCRLHPEALKRVIQAFEEKLETEFNHEVTDTRMTYGEALNAQALLFREHLEGTRASYQPLQMK